VSSVEIVQAQLIAASEPDRIPLYQRFFKTGAGEYAEGDRFRGVIVPETRKIAAAHKSLSLNEVIELLHSTWHEDRLCALIMMVDRYRRADNAGRTRICDLYLTHRDRVNHWDLVDTSAMHILGAELIGKDHAILFELSVSESVWDRRIAIISTFAFLRNHEFETALRLCENLLMDRHDLMHKACGWVLREIGKRDIHTLRGFLSTFANRMPRTMLRYSIEKLDPEERRHWMTLRP
jgi:3-methyladenine DNA glycosylase AlkD